MSDPIAAGRRLALTMGDPGAFFLVDRVRTGRGGEQDYRALSDVNPSNYSQVDRYLEGRLSGPAAVPYAAAFEAAKPLVAALPESLNVLLPEAFRHQAGVTSPPSWANVAATARGAYDSGRIVPWSITGRDQASALRGGR